MRSWLEATRRVWARPVPRPELTPDEATEQALAVFPRC
jgi:hypothetical protein